MLGSLMYSILVIAVYVLFCKLGSQAFYVIVQFIILLFRVPGHFALSSEWADFS